MKTSNKQWKNPIIAVPIQINSFWYLHNLVLSKSWLKLLIIIINLSFSLRMHLRIQKNWKISQFLRKFYHSQIRNHLLKLLLSIQQQNLLIKSTMKKINSAWILRSYLILKVSLTLLTEVSEDKHRLDSLILTIWILKIIYISLRWSKKSNKRMLLVTKWTITKSTSFIKSSLNATLSVSQVFLTSNILNLSKSMLEIGMKSWRR